MQRKSRYLSGNCPLSPKTLMKDFKINGSRWEDCEKGTYKGDNVTLQYDSDVSVVACLWKGFTEADGLMDLSRMIAAFNSTIEPHDKATSNKLSEIENWSCLHTLPGKDGKNLRITPKNLAKCMADNGVYSCARQEARQLAGSFPKSCVLKVDSTSQ